MGTLGGWLSILRLQSEVGETVFFRSLSLPHRCGPACGWEEGAPSGALPRAGCFTLYSCLEIHICWKVPWVGGAGGRESGRPGGRESRFLCSTRGGSGIFPLPRSPHPPTPRNHQLAPSPVSLLRIQRRIPASYRSINDAFTEYLLSTCQFGAQSGSSWEVYLPTAGQLEPALQHSHIPSPPDTPSLHQALHAKSPSFPRKIFPPPSPHHSDTT